ncbi:MAG TPA: 1,4-alpha-glucan branching protein GlgB [Candidatus Binatia bacterium]
MGAHPCRHGGTDGAHFALWAPNARAVSVVAAFNGWDPAAGRLVPSPGGIWSGFFPGASRGSLYKYRIEGADGRSREKADPFAFFSEPPPRTASVVWDLDYQWNDAEWMRTRAAASSRQAPISIYEVHLGSWRRRSDGLSPGYREIADPLIEHVRNCGFTHVELMPVMEHPFFASWGYQISGYYAASSRHGTPQDLMFLVDRLHQAGIGVILDWVPSHFPEDPHALARLDGTCLYEHADPRQGFHPDWKSLVFNYGRHEVRAFLISNALFWLELFHADGLRVDAVASMLYLDYSRPPGQWVPNASGGRENVEAVSFLRDLNEAVYGEFDGVQTYAEESTSWPQVSRPTSSGGLGFGFKWDMGWMNDTLRYMQLDPLFRRHHHGQLGFRSLYAPSENFVLPLSHDEVVHGKRSLAAKMPGDAWQRLANLRLLLAYMWALPGKKLLFMGGEIAQPYEWSHDGTLDWAGVAASPPRQGVSRMVGDLNAVYRREAALHEGDCEDFGFEWIDGTDAAASTISFVRWSADRRRPIVAAFNFTPVPHSQYRVGSPRAGIWREILNSDAADYGGSGWGNFGAVATDDEPMHGKPCSMNLVLPPLGGVLLRWEEPW